jgi:1,4-dihydroxy-2-naphthoyl-CoA synthase
MIKKIPDSRLVNAAADISALEDLTMQMIDETRQAFPEASHMLTEVLGYLVAAHIGLKDAVEWAVPLP